jgi:hypothetical protein
VREIEVFLADTHGGHKLSLLNPDTILFDDSNFPAEDPTPKTVSLGAVQEWLWECYQEDIQFVLDLAGKSRINVIHVGDVTWGNRHPEQTIDTSPANQARIAAANLLVWARLRQVKSIHLIAGTGSHEYQYAANDLVVHYLRSGLARKIDITALRHALFRAGDHTFDCSHHGPTPGGRTWLEGNELRYYLRSAMIGEILRGKTPPRVYIRGHYHTYAKEHLEIRGAEGREMVASDIILLPSYCGMTPYAQQKTRSRHTLDCGLVAVEVRDNRDVQIYPRWRAIDLRQEVDL